MGTLSITKKIRICWAFLSSGDNSLTYSFLRKKYWNSCCKKEPNSCVKLVDVFNYSFFLTVASTQNVNRQSCTLRKNLSTSVLTDRLTFLFCCDELRSTNYLDTLQRALNFNIYQNLSTIRPAVPSDRFTFLICLNYVLMSHQARLQEDHNLHACQC